MLRLLPAMSQFRHLIALAVGNRAAQMNAQLRNATCRGSDNLAANGLCMAHWVCARIATGRCHIETGARDHRGNASACDADGAGHALPM